MHVNLLQTIGSGKDIRQEIVTVIRVIDGNLQVDGENYPRLQRLLEGELENSKDAETFLRRLPLVFNNPYTRAQFVKD